MEFANENLTATPNRINLKNISTVSVKKSSKKALIDVGNVIHTQNKNNLTENSTLFRKSEDNFSSLRSPIQATPITKLKESMLSKMEDQFFMCTSCENCSDDKDLYTIPDEFRLSKEEMHNFATRWGNCVQPADYDFDPVEVDINFDELYPMEENSSYLAVLDESFEVGVPQLSEDFDM